MSGPVSGGRHILNAEARMDQSRCRQGTKQDDQGRRIESANRLNGTRLVAPHFKAGANLVADFARAGKALFVCAAERGWIWKTPVQSLGHTGKDRAALGAAFVADRDHVGEQFAGFENVEHGLSLILRNINPNLAHRFDRQRVESPRFEPSALRLKMIAANLFQKRFRHLAAGAVMDTDEQDFLFHDG